MVVTTTRQEYSCQEQDAAHHRGIPGSAFRSPGHGQQAGQERAGAVIHGDHHAPGRSSASTPGRHPAPARAAAPVEPGGRPGDAPPPYRATGGRPRSPAAVRPPWRAGGPPTRPGTPGPADADPASPRTVHRPVGRYCRYIGPMPRPKLPHCLTQKPQTFFAAVVASPLRRVQSRKMRPPQPKALKLWSLKREGHEVIELIPWIRPPQEAPYDVRYLRRTRIRCGELSGPKIDRSK